LAATASSSLSLRRPVMNTWAPSAANSLAVASAIPDVAPVITATLPSSLGIVNSPFLSVVVCALAGGTAIRVGTGRRRPRAVSDQPADELVKGLGLAGLVVQAGSATD